MQEIKQENLERIFLSALVYNRTGVLLRVASLFARRGYNVISLTVAETENPLYSRITIVSDVEPYKFMQVEQQLSKLEDVIKVVKLNEGKLISSELLLIKVRSTASAPRCSRPSTASAGVSKTSATPPSRRSSPAFRR